MPKTTLRKIAARLKQQKFNKQGSTVLFLGAGASISAGIPSAAGVMEKIETDEFYCALIENATDKTYAGYMRCLESNDRKHLIDGYITEAKINPAHLYAAHLIAEGYIDCVVTTNFDPLILRALALYNKFPAVYDLTTMRDRVTNSFDFPAVLFLHGQNHGFWQMNTPEEMKEPVEAIRQAFVKISQNRSWLVVGYSGNDPVFDQLASISKFSDGLYWAGYKEEPEPHVKERLINPPNNGVSFLPGYDADTLFRELNALLKLGDPPFIKTPFSHMLGTLSSILPAKVDDKEVDLTKTSKEWLIRAIELFEKGNMDIPLPTQAEFDREQVIEKLKSILANDDFGVALNIVDTVKASEDPEALDLLAWVFIAWGNALHDLAMIMGDDNLFAESLTKYAKAVEIKPDKHEAWNNWGSALADQAMMMGDDDLFADSFTKYAKAVEIKPAHREAWYNWGSALAHQAKLKGDDALFAESFTKFAKAVEIKPDKHQAWNNWGLALANLAQLNGDETLFTESFTKYARAVGIKPDMHDAWYNWGNVLYEQAKQKGDDALFAESFTKYAKAVEIKPDMHDAWNNWGTALYVQAKLKGDDSLFADSFTKYAKAVKIKPDDHGAWNNWGITLAAQAKLKEDDALFAESFTKYAKAVEIKPDDHGAWNNWGIALAAKAKLKEDDALFAESITKYAKAVEIKPDLHEAWSNWGSALIQAWYISRVGHLLQDAIEKCLRAEQIQKGRGAFNLACAYSLNGDLDEAMKWLESAYRSRGDEVLDLLDDKDLDNIRTQPEFQALLAKRKK